MSKEEVEKAINGLTAQYGNTAEFSVDQGKVVLDQENKRLEAENEALRKSVEELRGAINGHMNSDLSSIESQQEADSKLWAIIKE